MPSDLTTWLDAWRHGDATAGSRAMDAIYPELRAAASRQLARERAGHTLQPTALVNEAWLRLRELHRIDWQSRAHFVHAAAGLMRRILIDHARAQAAAKRDGGERVALTGLELPGGEQEVDLVDLDRALSRLATLDPRKAQVVELRYFGGLGNEEIAEALGTSPATVKRDWSVARGWLFDALAGGGATPQP